MGFNIVVLLDLNSFPVSDQDSQKLYLKWTQEYLLTMLTKKATNDSSVTDYSKIMWSFKFYNSAKEKGYPCKKFEPFTVNTFESFESSSSAEYEKFLPESQDCSAVNKCSCLSKALKEIVADFRWEEVDNSKTENKTVNIVYTILRVPRTEDELAEFAELHDEGGSPNSRKLMNALLPPAFLKQFRIKFQIQLNFIDTWVLHKEENLESEWDGTTYSRQVVKILDYLNKGKVLQFEKPQPGLPGLPSYFTLLKQALSNATVVVPKVAAPLSKAQKVLQSKADSSTGFIGKHRGGTEDSLNTSVSSSQSRNLLRQREDVRSGQKGRRMNQDLFGNDSSDLNDTQSCTDSSSVSESFGLEVFSKRGDAELTKLVRAAHATSSAKRGGMFKEPHRRERFDSRFAAVSRSAPQSRIKNYRHEAKPEQYSRTLQLAKLATKQEHDKWRNALEKEERERSTLRIERRQALLNLETLLELMKTRLSMFLQSKGLEESPDSELLLAAVVEFQNKYVADDKTCVLSLAQTVVQFVVDKVTVTKSDGKPVSGEQAREKLENTLFVPTTELRSQILKAKNDDIQFLKTFRLCQYQILVRMESSFLLPVSADVTDTLRDEIVDLLNLLSVYVKNPVDEFLNNVLLWGYLETHSEMLIRLYRGLNMDPPKSLILVCTPSKSVRSRCSFRGSSIASPYGSMESLIAPPSSSTSRAKSTDVRKGNLKRTMTESSLGARSNNSARLKSHVYVNNPKKMLLVPVRNVKKFGVSSAKPIAKSPKPASTSRTRVRRNLFDDLQNPPKALLPSSRIVRSPSLSGKSENSLMSPRLRTLRSKRRLNLDDDEESVQPRKIRCVGNSPDMFSPRGNGSGILCPGTPSYKPFNSAKKSLRSPGDRSPGDKVIAESPEGHKAGTSRVFSEVMHSHSFYSTGTGSDSFKSKVWEKSGSKMVTAKVKRNVDSSSFMKTGLTLKDIELLGGFASSPESKHSDMGIKAKSAERTPCRITENIEVVRANANANIEALIRSNQSLSMLKTTPKGSAITATPTKKITFNFDENVVRTPGRTSSPNTPKSILKTPSRYDGTECNTPRRSLDCNQTPVKELATHFSPTSNEEPVDYPTSSAIREHPESRDEPVTSECFLPGNQSRSIPSEVNSLPGMFPPNIFNQFTETQSIDQSVSFIAPNQRSMVFAPPAEDILELQSCEANSIDSRLLDILVSQSSNSGIPSNRDEYTASTPFVTSFEASFKSFGANTDDTPEEGDNYP